MEIESKLQVVTMMKSDKSIHAICIASIKRSTMKPYNFKWTKFYESNSEFPYSGLEINLVESELYICSTVIDQDNFSILTTRRLITKQNGLLSVLNIQGAIDKQYGDFKVNKEIIYTFGCVRSESGDELNYFIETGKASMVMIYGVRTLIGMTRTYTS